MRKGKLHIGTSGWNYNHWKDNFYPSKLKKDDWFDYYSKYFDSVEINNSFYKLPEKNTFREWQDMSPDNFKFAIKASRYITHMKKLKDPVEPVDNFLSHARELNTKLGPVLFQLPPSWGCNIDRLRDFIGKLPAKYSYAFEFRDDSWWNSDVYQLLEENNMAFCIFDLEGVISPKNITANLVYIRLHGPDGAYRGRYGKKVLSAWAGAINSWMDKGLDVFCYFDNDENGFAAFDAKDLNEMLT